MRLLDLLLGRLIRDGELWITDARGRVWRYGAPSPGAPPVAIRFTDAATPNRIARDLALGAGEAFMDGRLVIEAGDILALVDLIAANAARAKAAGGGRLLNTAGRWAGWLREHNPARRARANAAHHYDIGDELYRLFLDEDLQYSCAYFRDPSNSLEQAQADKKALIAAKLRLEPGMRVLEIGCGWGGLALYLAREHGVEVTAITLARNQLARARARAEGIEGVRFELLDYRAVTGAFDRVVSIAMFEAVGRPQHRGFFEVVRDRLTPDGVALVHTIGRADGPGGTDPWTAKYIFPGGYAPALSELMRAIEPSGLWTTDVEVWRLHYAYTLRHWYDRAMAARARIVALYDERFLRMWTYYLAGSLAAFRHGGHVVFHTQLAKRRDGVPITRDYLLDAGRAGG